MVPNGEEKGLFLGALISSSQQSSEANLAPEVNPSRAGVCCTWSFSSEHGASNVPDTDQGTTELAAFSYCHRVVEKTLVTPLRGSEDAPWTGRHHRPNPRGVGIPSDTVFSDRCTNGDELRPLALTY